MLPPRATVIMADFPAAPEQLLPDVRELATQIIARHGLEEWKAAVLTSELHRHLGTYSIVGAKMGLRARERFNVALDELRVESRAGLKPPLSCVNDGLQVATGASLGRGTITVVDERAARVRGGIQLRRGAAAAAVETGVCEADRRRHGGAGETPRRHHARVFSGCARRVAEALAEFRPDDDV